MRIRHALIYILLFVAFFACFVYMHEMAHMEIYRHYGVESRMVFGGFDQGMMMFAVVPTSDFSKMPLDIKSDLMMSNLMNDSVGYQVQILFFLLFMMFVAMEERYYENAERTGQAVPRAGQGAEGKEIRK